MFKFVSNDGWILGCFFLRIQIVYPLDCNFIINYRNHIDFLSLNNNINISDMIRHRLCLEVFSKNRKTEIMEIQQIFSFVKNSQTSETVK